MVTLKDLKDELKTTDKILINKMIMEILGKEYYPFRERVHILITDPLNYFYDLPDGLVKIKTIKCNNKVLRKGFDYEEQTYRIRLRPAFLNKSLIIIEYYTAVIGETKDGEEVLTLEEDDDKLLIPSYLEELFVVCLKAEINAINSVKIFNKYSGV